MRNAAYDFSKRRMTVFEHNTLSSIAEETFYPSEEQAHDAITFKLKKQFRCYNGIKGLRKVDVYHVSATIGDLIETSQSLIHSNRLVAVE